MVSRVGAALNRVVVVAEVCVASVVVAVSDWVSVVVVQRVVETRWRCSRVRRRASITIGAAGT